MLNKIFRRKQKRQRYEENVDGPFYVEKGCCIVCRAPEHEAPDLMGFIEGKNDHCYFKKQPRTREEVDHAIKAVWVSCCGAVRYSGNDPEILQRLKELGVSDSCDQ